MNEFVRQGALSLVAKVDPDRIDDLEELLAKMVTDGVKSNDVIPFIDITTIHFGRFVILNKSLKEDESFRDIDPILVFSTNFDGCQSDHIKEIVTVASQGLDQIYSHCLDYPAEAKRDNSSRTSYLKSIRQPYGAFHCGTQGISVERIRKEGQLRDEIEKYIDQKEISRNWTSQTNPSEIRDEIRKYIDQTIDLKWALTPPDKAPLSWILFRGSGWKTMLSLIIKFVILVVTFPVSLPILPIILRSKEKSDKVYSKIRYDERAKELAARENKIVQNQMTNLVDMKPGLFRKFALNLFFSVVEFAARYFFTKGKLGSIPTIHFARWLYVDNGRSLLFFSNYGSSWESYLGDFVDKAAVGLTGIWSNTVRYPRTKWLILEGATDEERFKCWARAQQMPTDVWYSAYETLTVKNILMNKEIRIGLAAKSLSKEQTVEWLKLL